MKPLWPMRSSSAAYVVHMAWALSLLEPHFRVAARDAPDPAEYDALYDERGGEA